MNSFHGNSFAGLAWCMGEKLSIEDFEIWCVVVWMLWNEQHSRVHEQRSKSAEMILEDADMGLTEYKSLHAPLQKTGSRKCRSDKWTPPQIGKLKLNVKAATWVNSNIIGVGGVLRDHNGAVKGTFVQKINGMFDSYLAECMALREGTRFAVENGLAINKAECDSKNLVSAIISKNDCFGEPYYF